MLWISPCGKPSWGWWPSISGWMAFYWTQGNNSGGSKIPCATGVNFVGEPANLPELFGTRVENSKEFWSSVDWCHGDVISQPKRYSKICWTSWGEKNLQQCQFDIMLPGRKYNTWNILANQTMNWLFLIFLNIGRQWIGWREKNPSSQYLDVFLHIFTEATSAPPKSSRIFMQQIQISQPTTYCLCISPNNLTLHFPAISRGVSPLLGFT